MVENVTQIKCEQTIIVNVSAKIKENIICVKTIVFGVLVHTCTHENGKFRKYYW